MEIVEGTAAVVTGAGGGMGRSIALALAGRGVDVVVADIEGAAAESVAKEIEALGRRSIGVQVDVSQRDAVEELADLAYDWHGSVEILVNNAGVTLRPFRASWDTSYEDYRWVMDVNFWGVLHGHAAFVPRMRATPGPKHIVNTSSMGTMAMSAGHSAYNVSKAAVEALSLTARNELRGQGIGVSILHPGAVRTRITTSERLRSAQDRSAERGVTPWSTYVEQVTNPITDAKPGDLQPSAEDPDVPTTWADYITPAATGWLVIRGIERELAHILTHACPREAILARAEDVLAGLPDYTEWPGASSAS
ncbi:SDR family oxidoreductase [Streptomyces sp. NPDC002088]|uniref:SDR family NAD(P)-dependent oxidoreductase n=1 Tax=unclassified Streptomyces TaxID=2593676 RepID=UPI0033284B6C